MFNVSYPETCLGGILQDGAVGVVLLSWGLAIGLSVETERNASPKYVCFCYNT